MKTCMTCGAQAPDNALACKNDGEASWGAGPVFYVPEHEPPEVTEPGDPSSPPFQFTAPTARKGRTR